MHKSTSAARWVARAITAAMWVIGSAYLIKSELSSATPDVVVIAATPVLWLVVITLPILVGPALASRQYIAAVLLAVAALFGSAYTLSGTLSRQSEARDARVAQARVEADTRADFEAAKAEAQAMLDRARSDLATECRSGAGTRCKGVKATIAVYEAAVAGHDAKLATLKIESPAAGESRVAAALSVVFGGAAIDYADGVALFLPALLGITLEIGALAAAMFGFHSVPDVATVSAPSDTVSASDYTTVPSVSDRELEELRRILRGRSQLTNDEVAALMRVTKSEASKRVAKAVAAGFVTKHRVGREVAISMH